MKNGEM